MSVERLFVYGTLRPGRVNHHVIAGVTGTWRRGYVRGVLRPEGWGANHDAPGIQLIAAGERVEGDVLESAELAGSWDELDRFEGEEYRRVRARVELADGGEVEAFIYELR